MKNFKTEQDIKDQNVVDALYLRMITWDQYFDYWRGQWNMSLEDDIQKLKQKIDELREAYDKADNNPHKQSEIVQKISKAQKYLKALTGKEY